MRHPLLSRILCTLVLSLPGVSQALELFDAHLHYKSADMARFTPAQIIDRLQRAGVSRAAIIGQPPQLAQRLYRDDPGRIAPLLGAYRDAGDKTDWMHDESLPARLAQQLDDAHWVGIGELHLFAADRHSKVFHAIVQLAHERGLPLLLHADPAVIDTVYEIAPAITVVWAHAGTFPYPDLVSDYLARYPRLHIDVSVRDARIFDGEAIDDDWYQLFIEHHRRVLVGVDTFSTARWEAYGESLSLIRGWLDMLQADVRAQLAYANAARIYRHNPDSVAK